MDVLDTVDIEKLISAINRLDKTANKVDRFNLSGINISLNAGGVGLWISVTCVIVLSVVGLMQTAVISDLQRRSDRMQDYLNAIYAQAPQLKPKEISK